MAKNREPVEPESSEEEYESESRDGSSSSDEEEEEEAAAAAPIPETQKPPPPLSSDESETESDESDEEEPNLNQNKPLSLSPTKPIAAISQKPTLKKVAPTNPVTPAKRPAQDKEEPSGKDVSKKQQNKKKKPDLEAPPKDTTAKKPTKSTDSTVAAAGSESSKKAFQRLWSDEDEIVLLQGVIDYEAEKKASPRADWNAFAEFIKDNLRVDVNKTQLQDKLYRCKQKYDTNRGKDRTHLLKKPHEQAVYDLSDKIWGHEVSSLSPSAAAKAKWTVDKKTGKDGADKKVILSKDSADKKVILSKDSADKKKILTKDGEGAMSVNVERRRGSYYVYGLTMEDRILSLGNDMFGEGNNIVDGAKEWKRLQKEDMELTLKKVDVKRAQIKLVLDNWH